MSTPFRVDLRRIAAAAVAQAAIAAALLVSSPVPAAAAPTTWSYPSVDCPIAGDHGLQDCIDGTAAGDTVLLAQDDLSSEFALIKHSLTLKPATGVDPTIFGVGVEDAGNSVPMTVAVSRVNLAFSAGVLLTDIAGSTVSFANVHIRQTVGTNAETAVNINASRDATVSFTRGLVVYGGAQGHGVHAGSEGSGHLTVNLVGTTVRSIGGNSQNGVELAAQNSSTLRARLMNNVIMRSGSCGCGLTGGLSVDVIGSADVIVDAVGNTIDKSSAVGGIINAMSLVQEGGSSSSLTVHAFDNVFSRSSGVAIGLDKRGGAPQPLLALGHNDFWHNTQGDEFGTFSLGSGNLHVDPQYLDPDTGDLRLSASSPLIDAGVVCTAGGLANPDAAGHTRVLGASIDMGAFERGAAAPTGVVRFGNGSDNTLHGTTGADVLCGMTGSDRLSGFGGGDYLDGGAGDDRIVGGSGPDRLNGGTGRDLLCARDGAGTDLLDGGGSNDRYTADSGDARTAVEIELDACP